MQLVAVVAYRLFFYSQIDVAKRASSRKSRSTTETYQKEKKASARRRDTDTAVVPAAGQRVTVASCLAFGIR
jgi:hypothetical protein